MAKRLVSYPFVFTVHQTGPYPAGTVVEVDDRTGAVTVVPPPPDPAPSDAAPPSGERAKAPARGAATEQTPADSAPPPAQQKDA